MKDGMKADNLRVATLVADSTNAGAGEVGTTELADDAVDADKLAISYNVGHFTLGTNGASVYVGFSEGGAAVTMDGSPISISITPLGDGSENLEPVSVVDYSTSGFNASGAVASDCMYLAFEEG